MRYRTAAIWSAVLIGGMFCLPAAAFAVFPSMRQGSPIPGKNWGQTGRSPISIRQKIGERPVCPRFPREGGDVSVTTEPKSKTLEESLSYFGFPETRSTEKPRPSKAWTGHPREVAQKRLPISGGLRRPNDLRHPRDDWRRRNWARCERHRYSLRGYRRSLRFQKTAAGRWAASC